VPREIPEFEHEAAEEKKEAKDDDEGDLDWTLIVDPQLDLYAPWLREVDKREGLLDAFQNEDISNIPGNLHLLVQAASHKARTYSRVPGSAMPGFINLVRPALEVMVGALNTDNQDLFTQALQCFLIIPQIALVKGPKDTASSLKNIIYEFGEGPREERARRPVEQPLETAIETLPPNIKKAIAQCKFFAGEGRYHKASQRLSQAVSGKDGALDPTEDVISKLRQLHPPASQAPDEPPDGISGLPIQGKKLRLAANRIANGSAADLFGWTGELVRHLVRDKNTLPLMKVIVQAIRDGRVSQEAREWLLASWLVPLDKGKGKVRPVAGGTILVKLAAAYLMENLSNRAKDIFRLSGTQYGLFMRGGATAAAHMTQLNLDRDSSHIALKIDFANAFNTIRRKHILDELYKYPELTSVHQLAYWAYNEPSHLLVRNARGEVAALLQSAEGVRQGCVLGSLAFGTATLELLKKIKKSYKDIEIVAYLDDVTISGKSESVFRAYDQLCTDSTTLGLEIQRDKCEILISKTGEVSEELQNTINQHGLHIQRGATPLLGTVVGTDENEIQKLVVEQMETWKKALELLACEELPTQLSLLIGRWTMTAKPSALTRSLPPNIINKPLADFGEAVLKRWRRG